MELALPFRPDGELAAVPAAGRRARRTGFPADAERDGDIHEPSAVKALAS